MLQKNQMGCDEAGAPQDLGKVKRDGRMQHALLSLAESFPDTAAALSHLSELVAQQADEIARLRKRTMLELPGPSLLQVAHSILKESPLCQSRAAAASGEQLTEAETKAAPETLSPRQKAIAAGSPLFGHELIAEERKRQVNFELFTATRDDRSRGELVEMARCYLDHSRHWPMNCLPAFDKRTKHSPLRCLVIAGALIAAEIDRVQRANDRIWDSSVSTAPADFKASAESQTNRGDGCRL